MAASVPEITGARAQMVTEEDGVTRSGNAVDVQSV